MVFKVKLLILFLISVLIGALCFISNNHIETNIVKTLMPQEVTAKSDIISIMNKSSSTIKVVFEGNSENDAQELKENFINSIDKNYFETNNPNISTLIDKYISQPNNFLSSTTKNLLINKKYNEIYNSALKKLYGVSGIQLSPFEKDPYFLVDDFLLSNMKSSENKSGLENYEYLQLKIKNEQGLSPDIVNKKVKELIAVQKKLSNKTAKIYLAGTPIHSYYTSTKAVVFINIICILSTILIAFLTYYFFKNFKLLIPIALSLSFGMLTGFCAVKLLFSDFQIITMVFCATIIGIGIDYSYHYFFTGKCAEFRKNLTFSFLTSIIPFILLYLSGIDLLKQVSVFIIFGLFGIFLVVLLIYPDFKVNEVQKSLNINKKIYIGLIIVLVVLSIVGIFRFKFNDSLTSLYSPTKKLLKAESLYSIISSQNFENTKIIAIKGQDIIAEEEKVADNLIKNNIEYVSISKFMPSKKVQKQNFELTKDLYKNNLDNYKDILSTKQINALKNARFLPVEFKFDDFSYLQDFLLDKNTSLMFAFTNDKLDIASANACVIDLKSDIQKYMNKYRKLLTLLFPVVILILYAVLSVLYDFKHAFKLLAPSLFGIFVALLMTSLIVGEINLFNIITIYLVLGFTMDYSIFRIANEKQTENAILVSCATTSFSFLLLSFCGFKLLSSMALILFFGIITSYLAGYFVLLKNNHDKI